MRDVIEWVVMQILWGAPMLGAYYFGRWTQRRETAAKERP